jgi:hypothetical protein
MPIIISEDTTWSGNIILDDLVQIASGVNLTIAPGTSVTSELAQKYPWFHQYRQSTGIALFGDGKLFANGTAESPIIFDGINLFQNNGESTLEINYAEFIRGYIGTNSNRTIISNSNLQFVKIVSRNIVISNSIIKAYDTWHQARGPYLTLDNGEVSKSTFLQPDGIFSLPRDSSETTYRYVYGSDLLLEDNNFYYTADRKENFFIYSYYNTTVTARRNWFQLDKKDDLADYIFSKEDDLSSGTVIIAEQLTEPNIKARTLENAKIYTLNKIHILLDAGVLGESPIVVPQEISESIITINGEIISHKLYLDNDNGASPTEYDYNDVDDLIMVILRNDEFSDEFSSEITDMDARYKDITYSEVQVALDPNTSVGGFGVRSFAIPGNKIFDDVILAVAAHDGMFVY